MNKLQMLLMSTILFSMGQGVNHYTKSSIKKFRYNLAKYHNFHVGERWIYECLRRLRLKKYITRHSRIYNDSAGHVSQKSSMISFTRKGAAWLLSMGITGALRIYQNITAFLKKGDKRWPLPQDFDDGSWQPEKPSDRQRLKRLTEIAFDSI